MKEEKEKVVERSEAVKGSSVTHGSRQSRAGLRALSSLACDCVDVCVAGV